MQFIVENYLIMVLIGLFLVFALIGYLIDMLRKDNKHNKIVNNEQIKPIETINPINNDIKINTEDSLLKTYEEEIKENNVKQDK